MAVEVGIRKRIASSKGRQFEIGTLKNNRKTALTSLNKQMRIISPLLADFKNESQVRLEVMQLDQLFVQMQNAHDVYTKALDDDDDDDIKLSLDWYDDHDKDVFRFKQRVIEFLKEAKNLRGDGDSHSVNSKASQHSRFSRSSSSSSKSNLIETCGIRG